MQPSTPQLNIDWRYSPQQEQAMSVERGIDKISATINDVVRQKREEDRLYNENLRDIISKTSGQYQDDLYKIIDENREKLKQIGSNGWKNNKELLSAREEILRDLTSTSQKANYVSVRVPQLIEAINKDPYADKTRSIQDILAETKKGVREINIDKIESIYLSPEYKDMVAVMRDSLDKVVGDRMYTSDPVTRLDGDVYNIYQYQHKGNLKQIKKDDGTVEVVPAYNAYKADGSLDEEETRLNKLQFVESVLDKSGNRDSMLKYFDDYFTKINAPQLRNVPETAGAAREKIVKELAADYMNNTVGAYDYKYLGTREKDNYISKQITLLNLKNNFLKQQINERAQEFYNLLNEAKNPNTQSSAINSIRNRIEADTKNISDFIVSSGDGEYFKGKQDRIFTKDELLELDRKELERYQKEKERKGDKAKPLNLYFNDGVIGDRFKKEGIRQFSGISYSRPKSGDPFSKEYIAYEFDWNDPKALSKFAVDWTNSTFNKNAATYEAVTGDTQSQSNQSGFTGGRVF